MRAPTSLADPSSLLVADARTVINLIATGCASSIIAAVPNRIMVVDVIPAEIDTGRARGRKGADRLQELIADGHLEIVTLSDVGWQHFEGLVAGPAVETLDDGQPLRQRLDKLGIIGMFRCQSALFPAARRRLYIFLWTFSRG